MILYLIEVCIISITLYTIYRLLLKNKASIQFNRFYLLTILIISISLPSIDINVLIPENQSVLYEGSRVIQELEEKVPIPKIATQSESQTFNWFLFFGLFYLSVSLLLLLRFSIFAYRLFSKQLISGGQQNGMRVFYHQRDSIYSFFNRIYIPKNSQAIESIIWQHERAHYRQLHSLDNVLAEIYLILFWINPVAWFIGKDIKENHEFLADQKVTQHNDTVQYMNTILQQCSGKAPSILCSSFSYLSIKNRIKMLQTPKRPIRQVLHVGIGLFLSASLLTIFSFKPKEVNQEISNQFTNNLGIDLFKRPEGIPIDYKYIEKISSDFGMRIHPITKQEKMHTGVDIIAAEGTEILSIGTGNVIKAEYSEGYGNHIVIQHNMKYKSLYAHLKSMKVKKGDKVNMRDEIGIIGSTGKSFVTHLHFELHEFDKKIDPEIKTGC